MERSLLCGVNTQNKGQIPLCIWFCLGHMGWHDCILPVLSLVLHTGYVITAARANGAFITEIWVVILEYSEPSRKVNSICEKRSTPRRHQFYVIRFFIVSLHKFEANPGEEVIHMAVCWMPVWSWALSRLLWWGDWILGCPCHVWGTIQELQVSTRIFPVDGAQTILSIGF